MKHWLLSSAFLGLAVVAAQSGALLAQTQATAASSPPAASPQTPKTESPPTAGSTDPQGILNGELPKWLRINGSIRGRWEDGIVTMKGDVKDGYYLDRIRLDVSFVPTPWLTVFTQLQDTRVWGYDHGLPAGSMQDPVDLRQGYIQLGGGETRGQWLRVGRQEVIYGAGRLFGNSDWTNTGRTYDVIRGSYFSPGIKLEVVAGSVVNPDGLRFDRHKPGEHFYGTYNALDKLIPGASIEPYFFVRTQIGCVGEKGPTGAATMFLPGLRFAGRTPQRIDYSAELVYQGGGFANDRIEAVGGTYTVGWTIAKSGWKPRVSGDYSHATGDNNAKDGIHRTFDQLYGGNQPFSSLTGLFGWKNIHNLRAGVDFGPLKSLKVLLDFRDLNLASTQDSLYNSSGSSAILDRAATSTHVGDTMEVQVIYIWPHGFTTATGVGQLFSGEFLHQAGQHSNYTYPYFLWTKRF